MRDDSGPVVIDGESLGIEETVAVAREGRQAVLSPDAAGRIEESRRVVEAIIESGQEVYGVRTGLGELEHVVLDSDRARELQRRMLFSHAAGVGPILPEEGVRAMMLHRANALAKGYSGVRVEVVELLVSMLNKGVTPVVHTRGSVGASGDLSPLAEMALVLIGEGEAVYRGERMPGGEALKAAGLEPVALREKEGLALVNGTQYMTAVGSLAVYDAITVLHHAVLASTVSLEALKGTNRAFDSRIMEARPHPGQRRIAEVIRRLTKDSGIMESHRNCGRHQDAYTLRCMPQIYGACLDALEHAKTVLEREINSATDNPLVFPDGEVISGGNFHGEPLALALDYAALATAEIGNLQERTIFRLLDGKLSGLPPFLVKESGMNSGFMIAQYTAAALVNENKGLAHPASVDSIPTSANQEDHVSMGATAANKLKTMVENTAQITAIHLLTAFQALDFIEEQPGPLLQKAREAFREKVPFLASDEQHTMNTLIQKAREVMETGELIRAVGGV
ncbi:MAG: histidine ammonia-lyase [Thermoplasmata archaeon]|nr:histidine ammonia-lyase [Thermoplasmata archaeon]